MCETELDKSQRAQQASSMSYRRGRLAQQRAQLDPLRRWSSWAAQGAFAITLGCAGIQSFDDGEDELGKTNTSPSTTTALPSTSATPTASTPEQQPSDEPEQPEPEQPEPELPPIAELCDGSDEIRLTYSVGVGFASAAEQSNPTGSAFFVIDGRCNYWLSETPLGGLRTGTLEAEAARDFAESIHFGRYATLATLQDPAECLDGGNQTLVDPTGRLRTNCGGASEVPEWSEAFRAAWGQVRALSPLAAPAWGPTRLLAVDVEDSTGLPEVYDWNSDFDLAAIAVASSSFPQASDWVLLDSPTELDALAELREAKLTQEPYADSLFVSDAQDRSFVVYVSDVPPEAVLDAVLAALASD